MAWDGVGTIGVGTIGVGILDGIGGVGMLDGTGDIQIIMATGILFYITDGMHPIGEAMVWASTRHTEIKI
jgi:hypothetical protein